jgi:hypothetical protein
LEHHSQASNKSDPRKILESQLRESFGRVVYSHKTHEKCADMLHSRLSNIKVWQIILSAITTGGFISTFLGSGNIGASIGVTISTLLLVLNAYTKNYDLGELAQKHKQSANDIWLIREKYLSLITDLLIREKLLETLQTERDKLIEDLHSVYIAAPSTTSQAYKKAQIALQQNEDMTFTDTEIDSFLPNELKKG